MYLNLNGFKNRDVMNEYLKVNASYYLEKDATGTPTGNFIPVEGSVFDLCTQSCWRNSLRARCTIPSWLWTAKAAPCAKWPK